MQALQLAKGVVVEKLTGTWDAGEFRLETDSVDGVPEDVRQKRKASGDANTPNAGQPALQSYVPPDRANDKALEVLRTADAGPRAPSKR